MKQLWLGLLATLITLPIPCQARPNQEGAYEVLGVGTISCEVWTKNRADKSNDRNFINGAWIQGYLTAVNVFGDGPSHLAKGTDAEGIMTWIDNYCAQHPGDSLTVAAKALVSELTERRRPNRKASPEYVRVRAHAPAVGTSHYPLEFSD